MSKRKRSRHSPAAFTGLMTMAGDMMLASAFVIDQRTRLMARTTGKPSKRDQQEMTRMVQEKVEAGQEAAFAIGRYIASGRGLTAPGVVKAAMRPFHKRARANAKRLRKQP